MPKLTRKDVINIIGMAAASPVGDLYYLIFTIPNEIDICNSFNYKCV